MNFTPFYIKNLTKEQQAEVVDKAVQVGANQYEHPDQYVGCFYHIGVDEENDTYLSDCDSSTSIYGVDAVEITLDQLDEHLGLVTKQDNKCTSLRNVKIDLRKEDGTVDEALSKQFQLAVFASGGKGWWEYGANPSHLSKARFIFSDNEGSLHYRIDNREEYYYFKSQCNKQISFKSIATWEAEYLPEAETKRTVVSLPNGIKVYEDELEALVSSANNLTEVL